MADRISAVSWFDGTSSHIRVYTSDGSTVTEQIIDGEEKRWSRGALTTPGSAVGATGWLDKDNQAHLRLYVALGGTITERCNDGGVNWVTSSFSTPGVSAVATSRVDSNNQVHIRVYVTGSDGTVTEQCSDSKDSWQVGFYRPLPKG